jgi:ABC-type phosphate transport system substrate-binding protein
VPLELFGPGTDSGTFDYFTDAINGEEGASRSDYTASEDDNVLVRGVAGSRGGLGYFGFSYYEENQGQLKALGVDDGDGCVEPSVETAQSGDYTPLSRPLFVYAKTASFREPHVAAFVRFMVANAEELATGAKFVPLTSEQLAKARSDYNAALQQVGG